MQREILFTHTQIQKRVRQLAQEISHTITDPDAWVVVFVMEGSARFGVDLQAALFKLGMNLKQSSLKISSYGANTTSSKKPKIKTLFDQDEFRGKKCLLVEDILDSGYTLKFAHGVLTEQGFTDVRIACLLARSGTQIADVPPVAHIGFHIPKDAWVDGYGIDTKEQFRGSPDISRVVLDK